MANKLDSNEIDLILDNINNWSDCSAITWQSLCLKIEAVLGRTISRQALSRHSDIAIAFNKAKGKARERYISMKIPLTLKSAAEKIDRLERENKELVLKNKNLLIMIGQLQMAAYGKKVSLDDLFKNSVN
jgi:hypothetical protein